MPMNCGTLFWSSNVIGDLDFDPITPIRLNHGLSVRESPCRGKKLDKELQSSTDAWKLIVDKQRGLEQARWGDRPSANCEVILSGDAYRKSFGISALCFWPSSVFPPAVKRNTCIGDVDIGIRGFGRSIAPRNSARSLLTHM